MCANVAKADTDLFNDASKVVLVRDFATGAMHELPADSIAKRDDIGSLMPPTAQALSKGEVADLLAYLFALRGAP